MRKRKNVIVEENVNIAEDKKLSLDFKFFKSCSATLKKFSVIMFVVNLFITIVAAVVGVVLIGVYVGTQMMSLLLVPILCVVAIFVLVSRLISALIYGFAEIVEKYESK
jgi:type III secretory pathway component EscS